MSYTLYRIYTRNVKRYKIRLHYDTRCRILYKVKRVSRASARPIKRSYIRKTVAFSSHAAAVIRGDTPHTAVAPHGAPAARDAVSKT